MALWVNSRRKSPIGPCRDKIMNSVNPTTTAGTDSKALKIAIKILRPGNRKCASQKAVRIAGGIAHRMAIVETRNEMPMMPQMVASPDNNSARASSVASPSVSIKLQDVGRKQLLAMQAIATNQLLPFFRCQPVDKGAGTGKIDIGIAPGIDRDDAVRVK